MSGKAQHGQPFCRNTRLLPLKNSMSSINGACFSPLHLTGPALIQAPQRLTKFPRPFGGWAAYRQSPPLVVEHQYPFVLRPRRALAVGTHVVAVVLLFVFTDRA